MKLNLLFPVVFYHRCSRLFASCFICDLVVARNRMLETFERLKIYTIKWKEKLNEITNLIMYVANNKKNPWLMPPTLLVLLSYF